MSDSTTNGVPSDEILLKQLINAVDKNNDLLIENNTKLSEQNKKMLRYTRAIYILTIFIAILTLVQIFF